LVAYGEPILTLNAPAARLAGQISEPAMGRGCHPCFTDVAIAAPA
jgi:hypothetical protein